MVPSKNKQKKQSFQVIYLFFFPVKISNKNSSLAKSYRSEIHHTFNNRLAHNSATYTIQKTDFEIRPDNRPGNVSLKVHLYWWKC